MPSEWEWRVRIDALVRWLASDDAQRASPKRLKGKLLELRDMLAAMNTEVAGSRTLRPDVDPTNPRARSWHK